MTKEVQQSDDLEQFNTDEYYDIDKYHEKLKQIQQEEFKGFVLLCLIFAIFMVIVVSLGTIDSWWF